MKNEMIIKNQFDIEKLQNNFINYLDVSQKTVETYRIALRQFFRYLKELGIRNPTRNDIIDYREWLRERYELTTVQNYLIALRQFFKYLNYEEIYPNITDNVKNVKLEKKHRKLPLTLEQTKQIMGLVDNDRDKALLSLLFTTGARIGEIQKANIEDIKNIYGKNVLYIQGKGHQEKDDYLPLDDSVVTILNNYLKNRKNGAIFLSKSPNSLGERLSERSMSGIVKNYIKIIGLDSKLYSAHSTRHTYINMSLDMGESLENVSRSARHKNIATTMIYVKEYEKFNSNIESNIANNILGG